MDRCAVFVDAGYVFAEGGKLCEGTPSRSKLLLDVSGIVEALTEKAQADSGVPVLRTYWYDGAKNGVPTVAQQIVAALPNVKLRLGRLNAQGQQKGVDALIYRDLMTLARERAISDAYLFSGDEDLREGVRSAQDLGVRLGLVGIAPAGNTFNQSRELVHEADTTSVLTASILRPFFRRRSVITGHAHTGAPQDVVRSAAKDFARTWASSASTADVMALQTTRPVIPQPLDLDLLLSVEEAVGVGLAGNEVLRRTARSTFWQVIIS